MRLERQIKDIDEMTMRSTQVLFHLYAQCVVVYSSYSLKMIAGRTI